MKSFSTLILRCVFATALAAGASVGRADIRDGIAINAQVFNGYARTKLADGSFKPERYAFGEGGQWDGGQINSAAGGMPFAKIARTIAGPLRAQNYVVATDPKQTDLLILVFWGTTAGSRDTAPNSSTTMTTVSQAMGDVRSNPSKIDEPRDSDTNRVAAAASDSFDTALAAAAGENQIRDQTNDANARILGYSSAYQHAEELRQIGFSVGHDTITELEANRYFVVLQAYDFGIAWKEKKRKLLWEARFSIYERGGKFEDQLLAMTQAAARHFGQKTDGLAHEDLREGKVKVGTPTVVEPAPAEKPATGKP